MGLRTTITTVYATIFESFHTEKLPADETQGQYLNYWGVKLGDK